MAVIACVRCTYMTGSGLELLVCSLHGKTLRLQLAVQLTLVAELTDKLCGNFTYVVGITVNYNLTNWLEKNKDPLNNSVVELLKKCSLYLMGAIWADWLSPEEVAEAEKKAAASGGKKKKKKGGAMQTVSSLHRDTV